MAEVNQYKVHLGMNVTSVDFNQYISFSKIID